MIISHPSPIVFRGGMVAGAQKWGQTGQAVLRQTKPAPDSHLGAESGAGAMSNDRLRQRLRQIASLKWVSLIES